jgi:hypothetical protein
MLPTTFYYPSMDNKKSLAKWTAKPAAIMVTVRNEKTPTTFSLSIGMDNFLVGPQKSMQWLFTPHFQEKHARRAGGSETTSSSQPGSREAALRGSSWTAKLTRRFLGSPLDKYVIVFYIYHEVTTEA